MKESKNLTKEFIANKTTPTAGVYAIINTVNDKVYIGQSVDMRKRLKKHRGQLEQGTHSNISLQNDVNKYGLDKLCFEILETIDVKNTYDDVYDLIYLEGKYTDLYDSTNKDKGYNRHHTFEKLLFGTSLNPLISRELDRKALKDRVIHGLGVVTIDDTIDKDIVRRLKSRRTRSQNHIEHTYAKTKPKTKPKFKPKLKPKSLKSKKIKEVEKIEKSYNSNNYYTTAEGYKGLAATRAEMVNSGISCSQKDFSQTLIDKELLFRKTVDNKAKLCITNKALTENLLCYGEERLGSDGKIFVPIYVTHAGKEYIVSLFAS